MLALAAPWWHATGPSREAASAPGSLCPGFRLPRARGPGRARKPSRDGASPTNLQTPVTLKFRWARRPLALEACSERCVGHTRDNGYPHTQLGVLGFRGYSRLSSTRPAPAGRCPGDDTPSSEEAAV